MNIRKEREKEMEIKKFTVGKTEYQFVCESWSRGYAWGHKVSLFKDSSSYELSSNSVRYYNRTWERYTYQTCMSGAVYNLIAERLESFINNFKYRNNINRFKKGQRAEVEQMFYEQDEIKELQELKKQVGN